MRIQKNLISLLILSTGARSGTILNIQRDYMNETFLDEEVKMYAIKLMPPEVSTLRMGKGQSQRMSQCRNWRKLTRISSSQEKRYSQ